MAIRHTHKRGDWLMVDDYTGFIRYRSQLTQDEYGFWAQEPDNINMQKYIRSFGDPYPIYPIRTDANTTGPNYLDLYVGNTTVPANRQSAGFQALAQVVASAASDPLDQEISYSLQVY